MSKNTINYPTRKKYIPKAKDIEVQEKIISEEDHKKRMDLLRNLGLVK
jgi:hypothetical protein